MNPNRLGAVVERVGGLPSKVLGPGNARAGLRGGVQGAKALRDSASKGGPPEDAEPLLLANPQQVPLGGAAEQVVPPAETLGAELEGGRGGWGVTHCGAR